MGKRKKSHSKNKKPTDPGNNESAELVQAPHSFVIHRGFPCPYIQDLTKDFRRIMEPFTALNLKERKTNKIKDFISLSGVFHVSHMCIFNKASTQLSFKVLRLPRGPTLTFKVHQFTLSRDILAQHKQQFVDDDIFKLSPLVIMNNFTGEGKHLKLMSTTFQNMFPSINLATVNIANIRRCLLLSYDPLTKLIQMRHYSIVVVPVGLSKGVKKIVLGKIPNLAKCNDISEFILQNGNASDSEFEDDETSQVVLPQEIKRKGNMENNKSAVKLHEIGPRLTMELVKIEDGLLTGEVLYHETVVKTDEEIENIKKIREKKRKLREQRKKIQDENKKKNENNIKNKEKYIKKDMGMDETLIEPDNDAEYYKEEVGEDPDDELFKVTGDNSRKRVRLPKQMAYAKKKKLSSNDHKQNKMKKFTSTNKKNHK